MATADPDSFTSVAPVAQLEASLKFERLLAEVSARFVNVPADRLDSEIEAALLQVCQALAVDRAGVWQVSPDSPDKLALTHVHHNVGVPDVLRDFDYGRAMGVATVTGSTERVSASLGIDAATLFPSIADRLKQGEVVTIVRPAELPPSDREMFERLGTTANVSYPLRVGGEFIGALSLSMISSEREWPSSLLDRLQIVANVFANALAQRRGDLALRASEARLRLAAGSANAGLWEVDMRTERVWATPAAKILFGFAVDDDPLLQEVIARIHPEDRDSVRARLGRVMRERADYSAEYRVVLPDGGVRWLHVRGRPWIASSPGEPDRLMGIAVDVSEAKEHEFERRRGEEELRKALEEVKRLRDELHHENVFLRQEARALLGPTRIIGRSATIRQVVDQAAQVAPTNSTVLLLGETGTGKERFASFIHEMSPRGNRPIVRVNCSAIPATLVESELFGREKGAYTGALSKQVGRFELAHGSTIFLDEIGELPLEVQVKLLRVIQERQLERLGSPRPVPVDVRIIAATNRDLERAVADGTFREDLYHRLAVFPITLPPLRDRLEDLPQLVESLVEELSSVMGRHIDAVSRESLDALASYPWPGNVRELRNAIERAMILSTGPVMRVDPPSRPNHTAKLTPEAPPSRSLEDVEREHLLKVLHETGWRIRGKYGAAEILDLKPTTLETRMAKLGIKRPGKIRPQP